MLMNALFQNGALDGNLVISLVRILEFPHNHIGQSLLSVKCKGSVYLGRRGR
jgi:hypothetical protein